MKFVTQKEFKKVEKERLKEVEEIRLAASLY